MWNGTQEGVREGKPRCQQSELHKRCYFTSQMQQVDGRTVTMQVLYKLLLAHVLTCLEQNGLGSDIIDGRKSKENSMLYMASVQNKNGHVCGGFLVSEDFVMTAAHCDDQDPTSVVLGTHNLKKVNKDMKYKVKKKCKYPSYVNIAKGNDIMLLKLSRKARSSKKVSIKSIQIPIRPIKLKDNSTCQVAGWGSTITRGLSVAELRVVDVPIINLKTCQKEWYNKVPANVICAGGYDTKKGICQGDSGGPLVCKGNLAFGIVSYNNDGNCTYPNVPNIYTDISKYVPWINDILKKKKC